LTNRILSIIGVILAMFGAIALLVGILYTIFTAMSVGGSTSASGTVIGFTTDDKGISYPIVQFPANLTPITFTMSYSSTNEPYKVGDRVAVLYSPDQPSAARVNSFFSLWYFPVFMLVAGGVLLLVGLGLLLLARRL
jgi:Protein of unknown function (DUF3592)